MEKGSPSVFKQVLDLPTAVAGFYVQNLVLTKIRIMEQNTLKFRLKDTINEFRAMQKEYVDRFAGALFDYIALASFGEARHAIDDAKYYIQYICFKWNKNNEKEHVSVREEAYEQALKFDPNSFLPVLVNLYTDKGWRDGYGGPKWANIAEIGTKYRKMPNTVFVDNAIDLSHNGGSMFNKRILFKQYAPYGYKHMLDQKRSMESILTEDFLRKYSFPSSTKLFLKLAAKLGIIDVSLVYAPENYEPIEWPNAIKWGLLSMSSNDILPKEEFESDEDDDDKEHDEDNGPGVFGTFNKKRLSAVQYHKNLVIQVMEQTSLFPYPPKMIAKNSTVQQGDSI